jgi:primosomal protein N' (replication factor Y)
VLGPVPVGARGRDGQERMLVRVPRRDGVELAERLHQAAAVRSARKAEQPVRIELDPIEIG